jgi:RNA-binding protein 5/10
MQGVLILQDQYRAILQYSFTKDNGETCTKLFIEKKLKILIYFLDGQWDKVQTDWYCGKCGVFNFKRRDNCFKCSASREESGSEGFDEISSILTKSKIIHNSYKNQLKY